EETYKEAYLNKIRLKKIKYPELLNVPKSIRGHIVQKINNGYVFTTIDQYKKDVEDNIKKSRFKKRKFNYDSDEYLKKGEATKKRNHYRIENITDEYITNMITGGKDN